MKKRLLGILTIIMAVIISASCLSGCNLITKDDERDMNQVIATVDIVKEEEILKKDMITAYINYGYMYVQYYGYTQAKTFNLIVDNLVKTHIMVQYAMSEFEKDSTFAKNSSKEQYDASRYLTEEQETDAKYSTYLSFNNLLDSYTTSDSQNLKYDSIIGEVRTVPTDAAVKTESLDKTAKDAYIAKGLDIDSSAERRTAYNKVVKLLDANGLLGENFDGTLETSTYFKQLLKNNRENEIINVFEKNLTAKAREEITFNRLKEAYEENFSTQQNWNNTEFVNALSSASASSPILYSAFGKYGFVYNLLLGASDYQTTAISNIKVDNDNVKNEDYDSYRKQILSYTTVSDLRSSWILSNYDYDPNTNKFLNDYAVAGDDSLEFKGDVEWVNQGDYFAEVVENEGNSLVKFYKMDGANKVYDDDYKPQYAINSVTTYTLDGFINNVIDGYVYGKPMSGASDGDNIYKKVNSTEEVENYDEKINELLFAFSTDSGSLNTYAGYLIKPAVDGANQEEYVETFANAGRELLEMGGTSYIIVASDYGYHVMFFSELFDVNTGAGNFTLESYLTSLYGSKDWSTEFETMIDGWDDYEDTDSYLYILASNIINTKVSNVLSEKENSIEYQYRYGTDKDKVTIFESRFADLIAE